MMYIKNCKHRLFYIVGQLRGGGLERQLWYILSSMDREKYNPAIAVWDYQDDAYFTLKYKELNVPIYPIERKGGFLARLIRLRKLIKEIKPEVLHSYSFYTNFPAWFSMKGISGIMIGSLRNDYWFERKNAGWLRGTLSSMFPKILISNSHRAFIQAKLHKAITAPKQVEFVRSGVDILRYNFFPLPNNDRFEIIGIGRLYPQKAWDDSLKVLSEFAKKTTLRWRFRLCGDGPLNDTLCTLRDRLSLSDNVEFLGFCNDVQSILQSSHVFLLTSHYEGTPNVVLEAMASGRPVIVTSVGDLPEIVRNGLDGFTVPVGNTNMLADSLLLLANNRGLLENMAFSARKRVESMFGIKTFVEQTFAVYKNAGWQD